SEWNGKYRDIVRDYWRGEQAALAEFAFRLTGSSDLYESNGRKPYASINFVTAHDGFSLHDLVSYNEKHNEANGENSMDGENHNRSWNCGVEGETDDPDVRGLRERQKRNFFTTLALSQGVPMILGGDEMSRTQHGNNNAYCQDNEISWYDWSQPDEHLALLGFTRRVMDFRQRHRVFRRRKWFQGRPLRGSGIADIGWFNPDGHEMTEEQWTGGFVKALGVFLNGEVLPDPGPQGERLSDDSFLILFNSDADPVSFTLPSGHWGDAWEAVIDTNDPQLEERSIVYKSGEDVEVESRSVIVLQRGD
ncbi:MAG: glycogen debranching enzyme, partial [Actinobacteria bacterium]|nr:glycogen debranching enzyme [Actinomycetota bacterium]